ncbi:MAG TPA: nitroreductase family protein [Bacteroidales bacterium]|nr:NAD(P)H nitroreductase [Bacteroidales bacterium]HNR41564.1 nitroreductase family protein [Bacteroidales bacterium]
MHDGKEMLGLILRRQSERKYSNKPVEPDRLERIIEAGRMAPSACNAQPWKFVVATDAEVIAGLAKAASAKLLGMNGFVGQANVIVVIVREKPNITSRVGGVVKSKDYSSFDVGIAVNSMILQAAAEGIGSCIIGWFDEKEVKRILGIPSSRRVDLMITLGYPEGERRNKKRKPGDVTVSYNRY